jgi:hypothetical protein
MLLSRRHHRRPLMKNQSHGKVVTLFYLELHEFQCLASTLSCIRVLCVDKSFSPTWRQQSFSPQSVSYDSAPVSNFFAIFHETFSNKSRTTIVYTQVTRERPFLLTVFASNPYLYCNKAYIPLFLYFCGFIARIRLTSLFVKLKCSRRSRTKHEYSRLISCPYHRPWPRHDSMTVHEVKTI